MADVIADIDELRRLAEASRQASAEADRRLAGAEGRRDAVRSDLKAQFGVETAEAARELAGKAEGKLKDKVGQVRALMAQSGGQQ
jgi:F0F1-type ATP synthase membrane subunit b/b'